MLVLCVIMLFSASASGDYTATTEELEFPELSNISRKCFVVNISSNVALESSKFFQVVLTSMAFNDTASVYIIQSNCEYEVTYRIRSNYPNYSNGIF